MRTKNLDNKALIKPAVSKLYTNILESNLGFMLMPKELQPKQSIYNEQFTQTLHGSPQSGADVD